MYSIISLKLPELDLYNGCTETKDDIPQPNMGDPGDGDLTLTFLGDAGVTGRPDMMRKVRCSG